MDIGVVGGGPCGVYIAYQLSKAGHKITLYEREEDIGGCWGVQRTRTNDFMEHAPRVVFGAYLNALEFFEEIGIDFDENFKKVYVVLIQSLKDAKHFTPWDLLVITISYLYPSFAWNNYTMKNVMDRYDLSPSAREYVTQACYATSVRPEDISAAEFFESLDTVLMSTMYEPTRPDVIVQKMKDALAGVDIKTRHAFTKHDPGTNTTTFSTPRGTFEARHDKLIVCIPPEQLAGVFPSIRQRAQKMSYTGVGVQFHYDEPKRIPHPKTTTVGSLRIIMTFNAHERTISCVILNPRNDLTKQELIDMTWKQLKEAIPKLPMYARATMTPTVYKTRDGTWACRHGSYYRNKTNDTIPIHDIVPGIACVGSHNPRGFPFTSFESAIETAKYFLNESGLPNVQKKRIKRAWRVKELLIVLVIVIAMKLKT